MSTTEGHNGDSLERSVRRLAESWRRRAEMYAATEGQVGENIKVTYRICAVELAALTAMKNNLNETKTPAV